jgi:hypothetical protein
VLLTTQYLDEADTLADRIVVIDHGTVIAEGTSQELKAMVGGEQIELVPPRPTRRRADFAPLAAGPVTVEDRARMPVDLSPDWPPPWSGSRRRRHRRRRRRSTSPPSMFFTTRRPARPVADDAAPESALALEGAPDDHRHPAARGPGHRPRHDQCRLGTWFRTSP